MIKQGKEKKRDGGMQDLVTGYNRMMDDPKEYANTTYKSQINTLGRPYGGDRDARNFANKKWNKNDIPV